MNNNSVTEIPTRSKKLTAKQIVTASIDALKQMPRSEIIRFGKDHGFDSRAGFSSFKRALISEVGIDLDEMKSSDAERCAAEFAARVTDRLTLFVDAKARCQRFAICDQSGKVVWYGRFFEDDMSFSYGDRNEQSATECAAARKAIWFASKVAEAIDGVIHLTLNVDAQWLCSLSGKAAILASDARKFGIELEMNWIQGTSNLADKWTTADGFKKWSDNDLASLVEGAILAPAPTESSAPEFVPPVDTAPQIASAPVVATQSSPAYSKVISRSSRGPEYDAWFAAHKEEWPVLRDQWKAEGLSSHERDVRLAAVVTEWAICGKFREEPIHPIYPKERKPDSPTQDDRLAEIR